MISAVRAPKKTRPKKNKPNDDHSGIQSKVHTAVTREIHNQINTRTHGMADIVRGPGKLERLEEFLLAKLPYHPQWVRKGTRYDAVLNQPLDFGEIAVKPETLRWIGSPLSGGVHAQARLLNALNSRETKQGRQFKAKLIEPLFSADHHLLLPEGTDLEGVVTQARPARLFHRGGQLRFRFERVQLPDAVLKAEAQLDAVEGDSSAKLKVDQEGGVKSTDSKTRLLNPVIAGLIAAKSMDNDEGKASQDANYSGRTLAEAPGLVFWRPRRSVVALCRKCLWLLWTRVVCLSECDCAGAGSRFPFEHRVWTCAFKTGMLTINLRANISHSFEIRAASSGCHIC